MKDKEEHMKVAALGDNCIDLYSNLERYYCTGNAVDLVSICRDWESGRP